MNKYFKDNQIEAFVFDMDGVLLDSESVYEEAWRIAATEMDLKEIDLVHRKCLGLSEPDVRLLMESEYGSSFDFDRFWKRTSDWSMDFMCEKGVPEKKGAKETLGFLRSCEIPVAVATSSEKSFAGKLLSKAGLLSYFTTVVYGDEVHNSKPDPEIYLASCGKLGADPAKCVAVEDSPNGIRSAYRAGLKCIMVPDRIDADDEMKKLSWKICASLLEIKNLTENNL